MKALHFAVLASGLSVAQAGPVREMFVKEQGLNPRLDRSYLSEVFPANSRAASSAAGLPGQNDLTVYMLAGDLKDAFGEPSMRADSAIMPTNADLTLSAPYPVTQSVWLRAIQSDPSALAILKSATQAKGHLMISDEALAIDLNPSHRPRPDGQPYFPRLICLVATDYPAGGSINRRDFFKFERMARGIHSCLRSLDALGATSVVMPLLGSASGYTTGAMLKADGKSRALLQCRMQNSLVGIALGVNQFLPERRSIREIGVVQYRNDIEKQFMAKPGSTWDVDGYVAFATSSASCFVKTLQGAPPKVTDVPKDVDCDRIFGFPIDAGTQR